MKNKIKLIGVTLISGITSFPMIAWGAFSTPSDTGLPTGSLMGIISNIMQWLLTAIGIAGVIGFAISGLLYLTAAGDEKKIGDAKKAMLASITGVIVALVGVVALKAAQGMLGGSNSSF